MYELRGERGEAIIVADGWIEKHRERESIDRVAASGYERIVTRRHWQRRFVFFGRKTDHLTLTIKAGKWLDLTLPADREPEVAQLEGELQRARASGE